MTVGLEALSASNSGNRNRFLGLQANAAALDALELDNRPELEADAPETLAAQLVELRNRFGLRILGGCCGTDDRHIEALARIGSLPQSGQPACD